MWGLLYIRGDFKAKSYMLKATPVVEPGDRAWPHEVAEEGREDASEGTGCSEAARERN